MQNRHLKFFFTVLLLALLPTVRAEGQRRLINNMNAVERYSVRQLERMFGKTEQVRYSKGGSQADEDCDGDGKTDVYAYLKWKGMEIQTQDGGFLCSFFVEDPSVDLFRDDIEGGLHVGDDISRLYLVKDGRPRKIKDRSYLLWPQYDGRIVSVIVNHNDRIMSVRYVKSL